ncbi:hypothetical protein EJ06DRAFT_403230 [Trichodelitschia bisporula]|uniref:Uncharacterized protein n=1 Tax=Trichodelitschia bisporula TaxID=703511 RepID=A0A6G1HXX1_9PEZI|nr:hypothetical protein EJ06DRAFT_403230 [Trichodelitschia bisporula]
MTAFVTPPLRLLMCKLTSTTGPFVPRGCVQQPRTRHLCVALRFPAAVQLAAPVTLRTNAVQSFIPVAQPTPSLNRPRTRVIKPPPSYVAPAKAADTSIPRLSCENFLARRLLQTLVPRSEV